MHFYFAYLILFFANFILCSSLSLFFLTCMFSYLGYSFTVICRYVFCFHFFFSFFSMPFWYSDLLRAPDTVVIFSCNAYNPSSPLGHFVIVSLIKSLSVAPTLKQYIFIAWIIFLTKHYWQSFWSTLILTFRFSYCSFLSKVYFCYILQITFRLSNQFFLIWMRGEKILLYSS